ncbi:acyl transferase acyl hydrolase lysophospholipase [Fusarium phyllophilum]|uniref:Acyl transferase acyl hydrolase lysophospholipase n=1 Tax=Fusarium phyllophilum TaxID=47803 RepID=A0A8H5NJV9_9HYPO|nr:acyl transferase acyl hydrolase lysophospholipase [Fusarium phyllophilum]
MGAVVSTIMQVLKEGFAHANTEVSPAKFEYAERDGVLQIPRYYKDEPYNDMVTGPLVPSWAKVLPLKDDKGSVDAIATIPLEPLFQEDQPLQLEVGISGHLDTLAFMQVQESREMLTRGLIEIAPRAYGVCSRDVMAAIGQLKDRSMAFECAGIIIRVGAKALTKGYSVGDYVMALSTGAFFASRICIPWHGVVQIPSSIDFTTAASLPLAFTTAYAGLVETAHLTAGHSVLIHAASGAVG